MGAAGRGGDNGTGGGSGGAGGKGSAGTSGAAAGESGGGAGTSASVGGRTSLGGAGGTSDAGGSGLVEAGAGASGEGGAGGDGFEPGCGNGVTERPEETCDDENRTSGDGCSATCREELGSLALGRQSTCALSSGGRVKCWGLNIGGQLGLGDTEDRGDQPGEMGMLLPEVALGTEHVALGLTAQEYRSCAVLDDGFVACWGLDGALGAGEPAARGDDPGEMGAELPLMDLGRSAVAISTGGQFTCALLDDASVKCWGLNVNGQLGVGDTTLRMRPSANGDNLGTVSLGVGRSVKSISAGYEHTCALLDDGSVKCWGRNQDGQLGLGDAEDRGDEPGEMGDALPSVDLGTGRTATRIAAGDWHTCALLDDATVKCWGFGEAGQLGIGQNFTFGGARGRAPGEMGDDLPAVNLGTGRTAVELAAGSTYSCAILDDGSVKCWGRNTLGQLGLGDTTSRGEAPGDMGDQLPPVDLGTGRRALRIAAGGSSDHTCALLDDRSVKCWGFNRDGQLGLGDTENRGDEPGEMGDDLPALELGF